MRFSFVFRRAGIALRSKLKKLPVKGQKQLKMELRRKLE
jgi:hypothetical protein